MSDVIIYDLIQNGFEKGEPKKQLTKLHKLNRKAKELKSIDLDKIDKKEILELETQWQELILDAEKLRSDYDMLIREMKTTKEFLMQVNNENSWRYKLAKWLIK